MKLCPLKRETIINSKWRVERYALSRHCSYPNTITSTMVPGRITQPSDECQIRCPPKHGGHTQRKWWRCGKLSPRRFTHTTVSRRTARSRRTQYGRIQYAIPVVEKPSLQQNTPRGCLCYLARCCCCGCCCCSHINSQYNAVRGRRNRLQ